MDNWNILCWWFLSLSSNDNIFFEKILSEDFEKKLYLEKRIYKFEVNEQKVLLSR